MRVCQNPAPIFIDQKARTRSRAAIILVNADIIENMKLDSVARRIGEDLLRCWRGGVAAKGIADSAKTIIVVSLVPKSAPQLEIA
jgi:hypothetical protein